MFCSSKVLKQHGYVSISIEISGSLWFIHNRNICLMFKFQLFKFLNVSFSMSPVLVVAGCWLITLIKASCFSSFLFVVIVVVLSALFVYQPVVAGATDARQLPVFVEREPLADMRVLNSAPASRGVPLHGSHLARGTLPLPLSPSLSSSSSPFSPSLSLCPPSLSFISFLSLPLSLSLHFPLCLALSRH